jgi:hypothetical protein
VLTAVVLFLMPSLNFAQAPPLVIAVDIVLFTRAGEVKNEGVSFQTLLSCNVGSYSNALFVGLNLFLGFFPKELYGIINGLIQFTICFIHFVFGLLHFYLNIINFFGRCLATHKQNTCKNNGCSEHEIFFLHGINRSFVTK